jgi:hypothetical protein
MTKNEALKIAIEALDTLMIEKGSIYQQALNACKEALQTNALDEMQKVTEKEYYQQPAQEPVEYLGALANVDGSVNLYFKKDQWQGLTDDEINEIVRNVSDDMYPWKGNMLIGKIIRAIEQALKDKNT